MLWRAYFKGWMEQHPTVWLSYRARVADLVEELAADRELQDRYNRAIGANTGIDCFDAWAKELVETGYLHNHARMWFASIWIFTLRLPWQMGADFFLRHLLDGDPAANTLSWRWVGGLHTRGKTYLARVSNIASYTEGRYAPHGQLATEAQPLSEDTSHASVALHFPRFESPGDRFGLLLTEDDLSAMSLLGEQQPRAVLGLAATRRRSPLPIGAHAYDFATAAVRGAVAETAAQYDVPAEFTDADDWRQSILNWTKHHELDEVVLARPMIGPAQEAFAAVKPALALLGIRVIELVRDYDRETWPYADRGYFKLKKHADTLLGRLGLNKDEQPSKANNSPSGQRDFFSEPAP